jgi:hypothetical protein
MEREKVIDKVKKLLAIANDDRGSEHEAHSAMLMAQKFMANHGLTMADVDATETQTETKEVVRDYGEATTRLMWYHRSLAGVIAKNFRCTSYIYITGGSSSRKRRVVFIGLKDDVPVASEVYRFAMNALTRLANRYMDDWRKVNPYRSITGVRNDYMLGFIRGLDDKFREQVATQCLALALVQDPLVKEAVAEMKLRPAPQANAQIAYDGAARRAGYQDGQQFGAAHKQSRGRQGQLED